MSCLIQSYDHAVCIYSFEVNSPYFCFAEEMHIHAGPRILALKNLILGQGLITFLVLGYAYMESQAMKGTTF